VPYAPVISGDECMRALETIGYVVVRSKESHFQLLCPGKPPVKVHRHRELNRGTRGAIIRQTEIPIEDFIALL
jgi:predicted RNA binding protein YcfA (HicA-like mRNA interferase family)